MKIVAGLGNPGKQYENTRHNTGFRVIDALSDMLNVPVIKAKHKALVGEKIINGEKVMLVKPMTFMNLSGQCIREIVDYYKLLMSDIIIVYDDCALPVGSVRTRQNGTDGGHNGMKSLISHLGTKDFCRVRVGVGEKPPEWILSDYVLSAFNEEEKTDMEKSVKDATDCVMLILSGETALAMNKYNKKHKNEAAGEEK